MAFKEVLDYHSQTLIWLSYTMSFLISLTVLTSAGSLQERLEFPLSFSSTSSRGLPVSSTPLSWLFSLFGERSAGVFFAACNKFNGFYQSKLVSNIGFGSADITVCFLDKARERLDIINLNLKLLFLHKFNKLS